MTTRSDLDAALACPFCHRHVDAIDRRKIRHITGYEEVRQGGGANKIMLREEIPGFAHKECIEDRQREIAKGISVSQGRMI